jgi:integrase/recombinase XerD
MLTLYRRHRVNCSHRSPSYRRCQCPPYVKGTLGGTYIRKALDQSSWDAASKVIGRWIEAGTVGPIAEQTIVQAVAAFHLDATDRGLAADTRKKYALLLGRLGQFATRHGITRLADLNVDVLTRFRATWLCSALTKAKHQERLRAFFTWCQLRKWIPENPARALSPIRVHRVPTLPFAAEEWSQISTALDQYPVRFRDRTRAFVLILRWSGLRIRDVVTLEWVRLNDGKLFLRTQKTGTIVNIPLPTEAITAWEVLPKAGRYPFWTGNGLAKSAVADWQRTLRKVFELAAITGGHAHRFRDTFAVELLLAGVDLQDVSILLGHSSVKVTETHYSPWVKARQMQLEAEVKRAWS